MPKKHDVDIETGVTGSNQVVAELKKINATLKETGKATEKAGGKAKKTTKEMGFLANGVKNLTSALTGLVGITALFRFFTKWLDFIQRIDAAQKALVMTTSGLDKASVALAGQAGLLGTQEGLSAARSQIQQIQEIGQLPTFQAAENIAVAVHSTFSEFGKLFTPDQIKIAASIGTFADVKGVGEEGIKQLLKLLGAREATTNAEVQKIIQQLSSAQQQSKTQTFGEFIQGGLDPILTLTGLGVSFPESIGIFGARTGTKVTTFKTGESAKQLAALAITFFPDLEIKPAIDALGNLFRTKTRPELLNLGFTPEEITRFTAGFAPAILIEEQKLTGLAAAGTAGAFATEFGGFATRTVPGRQRQIKAETTTKKGLATPAQRIGAELLLNAAAEFELIKTRGEQGLIASEKKQIERIAFQALQDRLVQLNRLEDLTDEEQREINNIGRFLSRNRPVSAIGNPFTPEEAGEADIMIRGFRGGTTINAGNVFNITTTGNDTTSSPLTNFGNPDEINR